MRGHDGAQCEYRDDVTVYNIRLRIQDKSIQSPLFFFIRQWMSLCGDWFCSTINRPYYRGCDEELSSRACLVDERAAAGINKAAALRRSSGDIHILTFMHLYIWLYPLSPSHLSITLPAFADKVQGALEPISVVTGREAGYMLDRSHICGI